MIFNRKKKIYPTNKSENNIPPLPAVSNKPLTNSPSMTHVLTRNIMEGFSFGIGSSIAHKTIDNIFKSDNEDKVKVTENINNENNDKCKSLNQDYIKCINNKNHDCENLLNAYIECNKLNYL